MASWFLIGITTIVMIGVMMFSGANLVSATTRETSQATAVASLTRIADVVLANAWQDQTGDLHLPMGAPAGAGPANGVTILPASLSPMAVGSGGNPFVYCPFGDLGTPFNAAVYLPGGNSYHVGTTTYEGQTYVTSGRPSYADAATNPDLMGFIMAPVNKGGTYVGCDQITGASGNYTAPGMVVRPIMRSRATQMYLAPGNNIHVVYVSPTGVGTGETASNPTTLPAALTTWRKNPYLFTTINLASGNYSLAMTALSSSASDYVAHPGGSTLSLAAASGTSVTTTDGISLPVNVLLSNLAISGPISVPTGEYVSATSTTLTGGTITVADNATFNGTSISYAYTGGNAFVLNANATANFYGSNSFQSSDSVSPFQVAAGATLNFIGKGNNPTNTLYGARNSNMSLINAAANSTINVTSATIQANSNSPYFINTYGKLNVNSSLVQNTAGGIAQLLLNSGSSANITNSDLFALQSDTINVESNGAASVAGSGVRAFNGHYLSLIILGLRLSHTACWVDISGSPMFGYSTTYIGGNSQVPGNVGVTALSNNPSTYEITNYQNAISQNVGLSTARQHNLSNWSCV